MYVAPIVFHFFLSPLMINHFTVLVLFKNFTVCQTGGIESLYVFNFQHFSFQVQIKSGISLMWLYNPYLCSVRVVVFQTWLDFVMPINKVGNWVLHKLHLIKRRDVDRHLCEQTELTFTWNTWAGNCCCHQVATMLRQLCYWAHNFNNMMFFVLDHA